eukprot:scaffold83308_cov20-Prasinocladus_malaysianus.AAC.2
MVAIKRVSGAMPAVSGFEPSSPVEKLADPVSPVEEVLRRCPAKKLMQLYKIPAFNGVDQFLQQIAAARGKELHNSVLWPPALRLNKSLRVGQRKV